MNSKFTKVEAGGNDFILIDRIKAASSDIDWSKAVQSLCKRKTGIGADGVLLLEKDAEHDFVMRIFNPDGQEVEMCGNGARCSAYYYSLKENADNVNFSTIAGIMRAEIGANKMVKLSLPDPTGTEIDILIKLEDKEMSVSYINTGVPHVIVETDKIDALDVEKMGRSIRYNERFAPEGTNADFVQVTGKSSLDVRTYERGVEEETLACGTGVIASAVIESLRGKVSPPVKVKTRGGEILKVYFSKKDEEDLLTRVYNIKLEGKVNRVYEGQVDISEFIRR
ncbi:diaminopimelate epimerase [Elusimicrobiota bacterium]